MENKNIIYYKQLDSTNMEIDRMAKQGAVHGTVVVASEQTAGKGRRGRKWESPAGGNIYMSILLRPKMLPNKAPMLTLVMAYAVAKVLYEEGFCDVQIKWPNDVILDGKKVCGILTEMHLQESAIDYVTVGVGINVSTEEFPKELYDKATSLYLQSGKCFSEKELIEKIIAHFLEAFSKQMECGDLSFLQDVYNKWLVNCGKEVQVLEPGNTYTALARGINCNGELVVEMEDGTVQTVYAGEVSVRGIYGYV